MGTGFNTMNFATTRTYSGVLNKLERQKIVLNERLENSVPAKGRLEECIEISLYFLSSPWNIYENGDHMMRQTILRLAFSEPLRCGRYGMYRTPKLSFPFKY